MTVFGVGMNRTASLWVGILGLLAGVILVTETLPPQRTPPPGTGNPAYQPPHIQWIRVFTYTGTRLDIQPVAAEGVGQDDPGGLAGFLGLDPGGGEPTGADQGTVEEGDTPDPLSLRSHQPSRWKHPPPTAVVGRTYRADLARLLPRDMHPRAESEAIWELLDGPPELGISSHTGQVEWVPAHEGLRGVHEVAAVYRVPEGEGIVVRYRLWVSGGLHPLGTNARGEDVLRMLVSSARWMIFPGILGILVAVLGGSILGATAGFYDGVRGRTSRTILEVIESVPGLLLILVVSVATNFSLPWIMVGVGVALLPSVAAEVSTTVQGFRKSAFVESSRELGLTDSRILWREILWLNTRPILARFVWYALGFVVLMEVTLSYLGMGVQPVNYSWGTMLIEGRERLNYGEYWQLLFPALAVVSVLAGCQFLGRRAALAIETGREEAP
ncbi:MAG: ABC transporter permease [Gemmatimonadales bacterium]|nr:MAG: ABC transporter permease [Gemmatimonadales bacterium]